ncbi:hypothetical protein HUU40_00205 [candidate division KSB1 bacterium]|nr:hypothetical protein [candidate division KSB1 bacterium]
MILNVEPGPCAIFIPQVTLWRNGLESSRFYFVAFETVSPLLNGVHRSNSGYFSARSNKEPKIVVNNMGFHESKKKLDDLFYDLHWVNKTPDSIMRQIPKRIKVRLWKDREERLRLELRAVQVSLIDVERILKERPEF